MLERYRQFVEPVIVPGEPEQSRVSELLNRLLLTVIYFAIVFSFIGAWIFPIWYAPLVVLAVFIGIWFLSRYLTRLGYLKYFSMGFVLALWVGTTGLVHMSGGLEETPHALTYVSVVLVAGMLLGARGAITATVMSISSLILVMYLSETGYLMPQPPDHTVLDEFFITSSNLVIATIFLVMWWRSEEQSREKEHDLARKAIEANGYKSNLIARVSHELRTPLGAILGLAEMLEADALGEVPAEQKAILKKVIYNAEYLKHLVDDLLEQSQLESGKIALRSVEYSPRNLAQRIAAGLDPLAREKGISLIMAGIDNLPPALVGDPDRISEIFTNLIGNAIKFTDQGGVTVSIHAPRNGRWQVDVQDTGPGIAPEHIETIFEPFRQISGQTITRKQGGVGLGLTIARQLVEMMGGKIIVTSQVGVGSTFSVTLPLILPEGNQ